MPRLQQLGQPRHLLDQGFGMEVGELLEVQLNAQIAFALGGVGHGQVQARADLAQDFVEIVAVDLDEAALFQLGQRRGRLTRKIRQHAHHHRQFTLLDRVAGFNVIRDLNPRRAVAAHPFLQAIGHDPLRRNHSYRTASAALCWCEQ
jgi:hypothetical protein